MLLDSPALWYRAFYGVPDSVRSPQGEPVNAVRGFFDIVARVIKEHRPGRLVATVDLDWRPAFRVAAIPSYKLHRTVQGGAEDEPASLGPQVAVILEVLDALGIPVAGMDGYEADDVIGTLATRETGAVDIVTGDRDLLQLVRDDGPVRILYSVEKMKVYDEAAVAAKHGIPGRHYADYATLRGDASDGLPGVKGVGEKTAAALVSRFGTVEAIVAALDSGSEDGFPLPEYEDRLPLTPRDPARFVALSQRWGLDSALERFLQALEAARLATDE
jgi:5'-3' exonuclease